MSACSLNYKVFTSQSYLQESGKNAFMTDISNASHLYAIKISLDASLQPTAQVR